MPLTCPFPAHWSIEDIAMTETTWAVVLGLACGHRLLVAELDMTPHEALRRGWRCEYCDAPSEATYLVGAVPTAELGAMTEEERWQRLLGLVEAPLPA